MAGDCACGSVAVLRLLEQPSWGDVVLQKGNTRLKLPDRQVWVRFDSLA